MKYNKNFKKYDDKMCPKFKNNQKNGDLIV